MSDTRRAGPPRRRRAAAVTVATALLLAAPRPAYAQGVPAGGSTPLPVVLVSIDGLKPEYVHDAARFGLRVPTLRALAAAGASARGVRGVLPTVTYPSHATLVTGAAPARHGILDNTTFDPLAVNQGGWYWYASDVRVPTLWDAAAARGLVTAAVHWPVSVGARITWNVPQIWRTGTPDDRKLIRALATDGLVDSLERRVGAPYADGIDESVTGDERRARFVARLIEWKRPALTLGYLTALDHEQHEHGPRSREAFAVLERVDAALDTIVRAAHRTFGERVVVAVVSDHGFAPLHTQVNVPAALAAAGLITVAPGAEQPSRWDAAVWEAGGTAAVVLRDSANAAVAARTEAVLRRLAADTANGIERVVDAAELAREGAFTGARWVVAFRPGYAIGGALRGPIRTPARGGTHGYLPTNPELRATFIVTAPGIAAGRDLGLMDQRDVAPTLAARLGVSLPAAEGRDVLRGGAAAPAPPARR